MSPEKKQLNYAKLTNINPKGNHKKAQVADLDLPQELDPLPDLGIERLQHIRVLTRQALQLILHPKKQSTTQKNTKTPKTLAPQIKYQKNCTPLER